MRAAKSKTLLLVAMLSMGIQPLAAHIHVAQNSRLGLNTFQTSLQPDIDFGRSLNALEIDASVRQTCVRSRSTSKERDAETGLDYFGARYMSSAQGRFTSADPISILGQKLLDPQQWNMYSYVRNNPLRLLDPTGMYVCTGTERECKDFESSRVRDSKNKSSEAVRNAAGAYGAAGDANGVTVRFGKAGDLGKNTAGQVTAGLEADPSHPGQFRASADVAIARGQSGTALDATVAHEGVHVEDAQNFASTITLDGRYDLTRNLTGFQTEMNAYAVSAAVQASSGRAASYGTCGTGNCVYGPGMTPQQINSTTMMLLANPANGYNRFIDVGRMDNGARALGSSLGQRQFPDITK